MNLQQLREELQATDVLLVEQFLRRMELVGQISALKQQCGMEILSPETERNKRTALTASVPPERRSDVEALLTSLFTISRAEQQRRREL